MLNIIIRTIHCIYFAQNNELWTIFIMNALDSFSFAKADISIFISVGNQSRKEIRLLVKGSTEILFHNAKVWIVETWEEYTIKLHKTYC